MKSIVLELQEMASNSDRTVSDLLRKAKIVAIKLDLPDFLKWVESELNGYPEDDHKLPEYRYIKGEVQAWNPVHGWQPVMFSSNEWYDILSKRGISQSIGELDAIMDNSRDDGVLYVDFAPSVKKTICDAISFQTDIKFHTSNAAVAGILDGVRNVVLDWSLKLEKLGILGEDMTFSKEEKEKVHEQATVFHIENFAGTIGDVSENSSVNVTQINQAKEREIREFLDQFDEVRQGLEIKNEDNKKLDTAVEIVRGELEEVEPDTNKISKALQSMRNIVEGAGGNLIAQGVLTAIRNLSF